MITPRPYQIETIDSVLDRFTKGVTRQLISLPTGCGKTVVFALLAKQLGVRTLVIAHSEELIEQAANKFRFIWPDASIGIMQAGSYEVEAKVIVASIQTAHRDKRLQSLLLQNFDLLIIDEAHHSASPSYQKLVEELGFMKGDPRKLLVGVTATPKRGDGVALSHIFEEISFSRSISTMIRSGYLSPLVGRRIVTSTDLTSVGMSRGDFITGQLSRAINTRARNSLIIENFKTFGADRRRTIVFCADVRHAKDLADLFKKEGIEAKSIYGDMPKDERKRVLNDFAEGKIRVLTNCQVLTEGFDCEELDCVVLARPTASEPLYVQMIGRGTRIHPLKQDCLVLDFCDNSTRHNLCNFKNTLDGSIFVLSGILDDENEKECIQSNEDGIIENEGVSGSDVSFERAEEIEFFGRSEFAWVEVGDSWHLNLTRGRDVWVRKSEGGFRVVAQSDGSPIALSERLLPLNYAMGTAEDWARSKTTRGAWIRKDAEWRSKPATAKQIETLRKLRIPVTSSITSGEASMLLDRRINEPATNKQRYWLMSHGVTFEKGVTKIQAAKLIGENKKVIL